MDNSMNKAVQVLQERLLQLEAEYKRDRAELEQAISNLEGGPKQAMVARGKNPAVVPGRWKGMCITDSVHAYLAQCKDAAAPFKVVMEALQLGGVQLGDPAKPARFPANVKTTIVNNRRRFRYDRRRDTVELRTAV